MKYALIIGSNKYNDSKLAQLKTPAADSQALAKILADPAIGCFDEVTPLINQTETQVRRAISTFLTNKKPDDLVLLYFSGHGVLDDRGRLYLALKDTQVDLLKATSIPSSFVADEMDSCRSKRQVLILDCCHSGAFARGTKGEQKAITETTFEGSGFGRVVLTASDSTQYALEGDQVIKQTELSLFTHFLLEGLKTGEADTNNDGHISLDEWYDYTYARVISETPRQVPHKWSYSQQGDMLIARNPYVKKKVVELPDELAQALESSFVGIRESAVTELGKYLYSRDPEIVDLAISFLKKMKEDDSRRISILAERLLAEFEQTRIPTKGMPSRIPVEIKPEIAQATNVSSMAPLGIATEIESPLEAEADTLQPKVEEPNLRVDSRPASGEIVFNKSYLSKWIGTALAAVLFSLVFYWYNVSIYSADDPLIVVEFAAVTGISSLIQWFVFRDRLKIGWVGANTIAGIALGLLHNYLYGIQGLDWWSLHLGILLAVWLVGNFVLGRTLVEGTREETNISSATLPIEPGTEWMGTGARPNIFLMLVSVSLAFSALYTFLFISDVSDLLKPTLLLYDIAAILVGVALILKKEISRNFGFVVLAIFSSWDGINTLLYSINSGYPPAMMTLSGILSLSSGIYFLFQRQILKHIGFLMLSGYLISISLAYFFSTGLPIFKTFLVISAVFAVPAAILLFLDR
jgi:uncharacterized caspase-like protein